MILTGPEIRRLAEGGTGPNGERITIRSFDAKNCGPASYDVYLGDELTCYRYDSARGHIDPRRPPATTSVPMLGETGGRVIYPGHVYLAALRDHVAVHRLAAQVAGRSSWGRYGLFVHVTAGFVDPGWGCDEGGGSDGMSVLTLELVATQPILVRPGDKIGQLVFSTLVGEYQPYRGRYQGDTGPTASRFHLPDGEVRG